MFKTKNSKVLTRANLQILYDANKTRLKASIKINIIAISLYYNSDCKIEKLNAN